MALHLAAGSSVSYTLAAGLQLTLSGEGAAQIVPAAAITGGSGSRPLQTFTPGNPIVLGPLAAAQAILIRANTGGAGVVYTPNSTWESEDSSRTLTAADNGKLIAATTAITITVPSGLSPRPSVGLQAPPSGNLSVTGTLNGSSQTLTRTRATNPAGVTLAPYVDVDGYGLSGS